MVTMKGRESTNGKAAEHLLKSWRKFNIVGEGFEINLSEIRGTIHADLHIETTMSCFTFTFIIVLRRVRGHAVLPKRSNWWPSHNLCPVVKDSYFISYPNGCNLFTRKHQCCWLKNIRFSYTDEFDAIICKFSWKPSCLAITSMMTGQT